MAGRQFENIDSYQPAKRPTSLPAKNVKWNNFGNLHRIEMKFDTQTREDKAC